MSKGEALVMAIVAVSSLILFGTLLVCIVAVLSIMKPIGWIVLGVILLVTILVWIGIYQYDKHF